MRRSRRLALVAVALPLLAVLGGCELKDKANAIKDKASICAQALELSTLFPDANNPNKTKDEALDKANKLKSLAKNVEERDVQGALTGLADQYVDVTNKRAEDFKNMATWVDKTSKRTEALKKTCL